MRLRLEYPGDRFEICVVVLSDGKAPSLEFLEYIRKHDPKAHRSIVRRYEMHANHGPLANKQIASPIKGRKNLFQFKASRYRLLWFYHPHKRHVTVLTNGFQKGDPADPQFDRAEQFRDAVLSEEARHGSTR